MLFNSFVFLIFFPAVCLLYYAVPHRFRWVVLLAASYWFYVNWIPAYAILILFSTVVTYACGRLVDQYRGQRRKQKIFLVVSMVANLGLLVFFKYYNFLGEAVLGLLSWAGVRWEVPGLDVLLPVGISFYTFQAIGYTIDVYRDDMKPEKHFGIYALFVSFFPQLVAGPIERAQNLLPQFHLKHTFEAENLVSGFRNMLWGYFMKLCVADRLAAYVDAVFNNPAQHNGGSYLLASIFFTIQIYCDFAGYSLIALGAARVMGFRLMENFRRPFFSKNVREFWSRWHISLSSWFRDYVYIPLGGNRVRFSRHLTNLLVTFVISGLWHGANWTFLAWGAIHGIYQIVAILRNRFLPRVVLRPAALQWTLNTVVTFGLVVLAFIFFRADNISHAARMIGGIFTSWDMPFTDPNVFSIGLMSLAILVFKESVEELNLWPGRKYREYRGVRYISTILLALFILLAGVLDGGQFIYFQF